MSSTPEIASKISPISGSINRNLLTPCRRVGLSRKRKTPNSIEKISSENSPISNNHYSFSGTTPVNHRKSMKRKSDVNPHMTPSIKIPIVENSALPKVKDIDIKNCTDDFVKKQSKKDLFQSCSDDLFDGSDSSFTNMEDAESSTNCTNAEILEISQNELFLDQPICNTDYTNSVNNTSLHLTKPKTHCLSSSDKLVISDLNPNNNGFGKLNKSKSHNLCQENDSDEDFMINKSNCNQKQKLKGNKVIKQKRIRKTLSLKNSVSLTDTDDEFDGVNCNQISNRFKECHVQLQKVVVNKTRLSESETYKSYDKSTNIIIIDEEEDAFTSTPEEKTKKIDMLQKVRSLEKIVKQKQQQLTDLRRASIYKNKHNIDDLKQLTSKWTTGCVSGLNDLLTQLQAHGPMNMTTLLNNLHIPSDIVAKLSLSID